MTSVLGEIPDSLRLPAWAMRESLLLKNFRSRFELTSHTVALYLYPALGWRCKQPARAAQLTAAPCQGQALSP